MLTGAGSSAFAGALLAPALAETMRRRVDPVATTTILGGPGAVFVEDAPTLLVSFARSGNSPESVAAAALADQLLTSVWHLVVCCNADSDLARTYADDDRALVLLMPPAAHDAGFAMTSSFTSMVLGCWFALTGTAAAGEVVDRLARGADALLAAAGEVATLGEGTFTRVAYLGSGPLAGLAQEAALKLLELTAGGVVGQHDSPLGFRHGPKAMLTDDTLVVVLRSTDDYTAQYDDDIVAELTRDLDPRQVVVLSSRPLPRRRRGRGRLDVAGGGAGGPARRAGRRGLRGVRPAVRAAELDRARADPGQPVPVRRGQPGRARGERAPVPGVSPGAGPASGVYLGVDGGGTKTALCLVSGDGRLLARRDAPSCYYLGAGQDVGPGLVAEVLGEAVPAVCADAGLPVAAVDGAFFGLPAYGEASKDLPALDAIPAGDPRARPLPLRQRHGLRLGRFAGPGARRERRERHRVHQLRRARRPPRPRRRLGRAVRRRGFRVLAGGPRAAGVDADDRRPRAGRAAARPPGGAAAAGRAARPGQPGARDVAGGPAHRRRARAARGPGGRAGRPGRRAHRRRRGDRARAAGPGRRRPAGLRARARSCPVACSGGVFGSPTVRDAFAASLAEAGGFELRPSRFSPVVGAALYAAREVGAPLAPDALVRLEAQERGRAGRMRSGRLA